MLQFGNELMGKGIDDFGKNQGRDRVVEILTNPMKYKEWLKVLNEQKTNDDSQAKKDKEPESIAEELMKIANSATYFHTNDKKAYADVFINEHRVTYPLRSKNFKLWLMHKVFLKYKNVPSNYVMTDTLNALEGKAIFEGECRQIYNRLAEYEGKIYIDLGSSDWTAVEVSSSGWQIVSDYPVRFKRSQNQQSLPIPTDNGDINQLRQIINLSDSDWILVLCWLSFCFYPNYPHPILILHGEQGSGKSFASIVLTRLVDPNISPLLPEPSTLHDLAITAQNRWLIAFDNLSGIRNELSDALCRIATGGGFASRTLYENEEETVFKFMRPMIINGIDSLATRSDLLERSLLVTLPKISEESRLTEIELQEKVERILPSVFGALLTSLSQGISTMPDVKTNRLPRMADFAKWSISVETSLGFESGSFMEAYDGNRAIGHEQALEASPVALTIQRLMASKDSWNGSPTELLEELDKLIDDKTRKSRAWSGTSRSLGKALVRVAPDLRAIGISLDQYKGTNGKRFINLEKEVKLTPQTPLLPQVSLDQSLSNGISESSNVINRSRGISNDAIAIEYPANVTINTSMETESGKAFQLVSEASGVSGVSISNDNDFDMEDEEWIPA
jgi:hypothetical protein